MTNEIVTLPVTAHLGILRRFIERERGMRLRVLKGDSQRKGLADADEALKSLDAVSGALRRGSEAL